MWVRKVSASEVAVVKEFLRAFVDDVAGRSGDGYEHGRGDVAVLLCFLEDERVGVLKAMCRQLVGFVDSFVFGYACAGHLCVIDFFELFELFDRPE